jgi:Carboxypeptidase regulatory-like domain
MKRAKIVVGASLGALVWVLLPEAAAAQQASGITGIVRDSSGAALPGVTIEATSPVLIEKARTVYTDPVGRYSIIDLRPGTYTVTFTLPGFSVVKREGIVLTVGFTATVNADLQVGAVEETITVSGAAPLVDTANVRAQTVVATELLEAVPSLNMSMNMVAVLTPGLSMAARSADLAGARADFREFHGKWGTVSTFEGMGIENLQGAGATGYIVNMTVVDETTVQTSGISAEAGAEGALVNFVGKSGANRFSGSFSGLYTNSHLQSDNMTDTLRARGLPEGNLNKIMEVYDAGFTLGGPIKMDRAWFYVGLRRWGNAKQGPGFYNKTQGTPFYNPDLTRPSDEDQFYFSKSARITWQVSPRNNINVFIDPQTTCRCGAITENDPVVGNAFHTRGGLHVVRWNSPVTNRLLFEAGEGSCLAAGTSF